MPSRALSFPFPSPKKELSLKNILLPCHALSKKHENCRRGVAFQRRNIPPAQGKAPAFPLSCAVCPPAKKTHATPELKLPAPQQVYASHPLPIRRLPQKAPPSNTRARNNASFRKRCALLTASPDPSTFSVPKNPPCGACLQGKQKVPEEYRTKRALPVQPISAGKKVLSLLPPMLPHSPAGCTFGIPAKERGATFSPFSGTTYHHSSTPDLPKGTAKKKGCPGTSPRHTISFPIFFKCCFNVFLRLLRRPYAHPSLCPCRNNLCAGTCLSPSPKTCSPCLSEASFFPGGISPAEHPKGILNKSVHSGFFSYKKYPYLFYLCNTKDHA